MTTVFKTEEENVQVKPVAQPEPDLTPAGMIARAEAMLPMLRDQQAFAEATGNISAATNQAMIDAGFYRVVQPRFFGGYQFDQPTYMKLAMAVARGCPEAAWVLSLNLGHVHQLATFPIEAQIAAYGPHGDFRAPEVAAPQGRGVAVPGGYRVSGEWDYASGCEHGTHALLVFLTPDPVTGEAVARMGLFDRADYAIIRNWDVIAMQGTGSDRIVLDDVFIPEVRVKPFPERRDLRILRLPDLPYRGAALFHAPSRPFVIMESASVVVGAAEGMLDLYEESFRTRKPMGPGPAHRYELAEYQLNFGRCTALIATARAALLQAAADYMDLAGETMETRRVCAEDVERKVTLVVLQTVHLAHEAADIMFRTVGSTAARKDSMIGRYWRNIGVLRGHLAHQSDSSAINYGRIHFGMEAVGIS